MINANHIAFNAFREWISATPELSSSIETGDDHLQKICFDLEQAIEKALLAVEQEYGGHPKDGYELGLVYGFVEGYVKGNLSVRWSNRYLPPKPYIDYQLWILSIKNYLAVDAETRLRVNRLYTYYRENYSSIEFGAFSKPNNVDTGDLHAHHILSDIKADINWKNFLNLFDTFFEEDVSRALSERSIIEFRSGTRIFTRDELQHLYSNRKRI